MTKRLRSWFHAWFGRSPAAGESARPNLPFRQEEMVREQGKVGRVDAAGAPATADRDGDPQKFSSPGIHKNVVAGTEISATGPGAFAHEIEAILGIDFGTSSTKVVVRLPFEQGDPTFAVPALEFARAEENPDLWKSQVWLDRHMYFRLDGSEGAERLEGLKATLMRNADAAISNCHNIAAKEAVCAFLALMINEARGWFVSRHRDILGPRQVQWSYHFGFPAASLDNTTLKAEFERCAVAAIRLARAGPITLTAIRDVPECPANDCGSELSARQGALFPEVAAAVAGFAHTQRREDGLYALIDVGAGTLDCCTFNLWKAVEGVMQCPILEADVEMLGVEPWQACRDVPARREEFLSKLDQCPRGVIWRTRHRRYPDSPRWATELPLFFIGGGAESEAHRAMAEQLDCWLRRHVKPGGGVRLMNLPMPQHLSYKCRHEQVHRLAVAVGLSLPADMIPKVALPHIIDDVSPRQIRPIEERYIEN